MQMIHKSSLYVFSCVTISVVLFFVFSLVFESLIINSHYSTSGA